MIAFAAEEGSFIPTRAQHALLRAALLPDRDAVKQAFAEWKSLVPIDDVEIGTFRMLPLVYSNLQRLGVDDELLTRLKGVYRQSWFRSQLVRRAGFEAVRALNAAEVPVLLIKGAALTATVYGDVALRPMEDFDVVVPRPQFSKAAGVVMSLGWALEPGVTDTQPHFEFHHAVALHREGAGDLDLHWCSMYGSFDRAGEEAFWEQSREVREEGAVFRVLCPADQLLQVCAHATHRSPGVAPIRWVADAYLLLAKEGSAFDWTRLIAIAKLRRLSLGMLRCLEYLRDGLDCAVPASATEALARNVRAEESLLLHLRGAQPATQRWYAAMVWIRLVFLDGPGAVPRRLGLLRRYLRSSFRVPSNVPLAAFIVTKIFRRQVAPSRRNRDTSAS